MNSYRAEYCQFQQETSVLESERQNQISSRLLEQSQILQS